MKKTILLFIITLIIPVFGFAQSIENLDHISSFHDDLAAINKDGQWAFINRDGDIVINFRNDLVATKSDAGNYPIFNNDRCLILKEKDGISFFGYIDTSGKTVIEPQFLNATNFNNGKAIVLKLVKEIMGENEALEKQVIYYKYYEVIIDTNGTIDTYLNPEGVNFVLDKKKLHKPPLFKSKQMSENLFAILNENKKWTIIKINE